MANNHKRQSLENKLTNEAEIIIVFLISIGKNSALSSEIYVTNEKTSSLRSNVTVNVVIYHVCSDLLKQTGINVSRSNRLYVIYYFLFISKNF